MKAFLLFPFLAVFLLSGIDPALAQGIPPNPLVPKGSVKSSKRNLGGGGDLGTNAGLSSKPATTRTVIVQHVAVTPVQGWTNTSGKTIQARVLAFSAPKPGESGPIEVIREGKIRFLMPGKSQPMDYPLDQLKKEDKEEIERIAKAAARVVPEAKAEADAEGEGKKKPDEANE